MRSEEFSIKHARLKRVLQAKDSDAVVLNSAGALSWLLAGARVHVSLAGPPVVRAVVHHDGVELAVFRNEFDRIVGEELEGIADSSLIRIHPIDWFADIDDVTTWLPIARAWNLVSEAQAGYELRSARASLLETEIQRYRALCSSAATVLTDTLSHSYPETREMDVASSLAEGITGLGAEAVVLLVQGDSRGIHRHPLPTHSTLGRRAMAVVCARQGGLIANVTRWARFDEPTPGELETEAAILEVEADMFDATMPGNTLESVLDVVKTSYPQHGFSAEEWLLHHQGGAAGYQGRDPRVAPGVKDVMVAQQPFAWNPSGWSVDAEIGAKVEDTVLLGATGGEIEVLSTDPRWPTVEVRGRRRPLTLQR